jgi:branched-chain amino acid transport system ATP-binding protein
MLLELEDVRVRYGNIEAVKGITMHVDEGQIVALIGGNGAGKTTTLKTIAGIQATSAGKISFAGEVISALPSHEVVTRGLSLTPEGRRIFPRMNVRENLEMGAFQRTDAPEIKDDMERIFTLFPVLRERAKQAGGTLSGGEQQMLMLDEPSMGLAPLVVEKIFQAIEEINKEGTTILLVEQNAQIALTLASWGYVLESGEIVLSDEAGTLLRNDRVRKAYLGED